MPSTAFSSQGCTFQISTGTGSAKTITAISTTFPIIVTSTAHGLGNGDSVALAAVVGTMSTGLNGNSFIVSNVTTNTFALQFDGTGLTYTSGGTATPVTFTTINNIKSFAGFDGTSSEIDVTNLSSVAKEVRLGLEDFGKFGFDIDVDFSDAGQNALRTAKTSGASKTYKLTYPNTKVATFAGYVKGTPQSGGVDKVVSGSVEIRISGAVTVA